MSKGIDYARNNVEASKGVVFDEDAFNNLLKFGDTVIAIDRLPAKLSIHALNLMMGTFTLTSNQIIVSCPPNQKEKEIMSVRIVLKSTNDDIQRILSKNKCKTAYDTILRIECTDFNELKQFMFANGRNLRKLSTADRCLPINRVGYSNGR